MKCRNILKCLQRHKRALVLFLTPIALSPIPLIATTPAGRAAYGIAIMATYWVTEVTPIAVTSLLPLVLFPVLGVVEAKVISKEYMKDTNVLLIGGLLIAVGIETWDVHKRVALAVLLIVGVEPRRLMFGFMLITAIISMWISNTATTAMMTPIMEAILVELHKKTSNLDDEEENIGKSIENDDVEELDKDGELESLLAPRVSPNRYVLNEQDLGTQIEMESFQEKVVSDNECEEFKGDETKTSLRQSNLSKALLLSVCYSANIGGTGTLTGSGPQLVLSGQANEIFENGPQISFLYWFVYAFPQMLLFLVIAWIYLQFFFLGISWNHICSCFRRRKNKTKAVSNLHAMLKNQYEDLGPISFAETEILVCFVCVVLLWLFRLPEFMPGWGELFKEKYVTDATAAMIVAFMLFQLPSQMPDIFRPKGSTRKKLKQECLLEWSTVQSIFPWNIMLLLGAGFALAKACDVSKLSVWLSCQMTGLKVLSQVLIVLIICIMLTFLTEFTSNTATATILLPILASLAKSIEVHPYYMMIPATVCTSFAFMLPVATPPNAIVFSTGRLTVQDMAKAGFGMNIIGILIVTLSINTWGYAYYGLGEFPSWAFDGNTTSQCGGPLINATHLPTLLTTTPNMTFI